MRTLHAGAIAVLIVMLAAVGYGGYALGTQTAETEVRISARPLGDGRMEFALQQRDGNGWSERQLARARYMPANAEVGRWLNSSAYTVGVPLNAAEERVAAANTANADQFRCGRDGELVRTRALVPTSTDGVYWHTTLTGVCVGTIAFVWGEAYTGDKDGRLIQVGNRVVNRAVWSTAYQAFLSRSGGSRVERFTFTDGNWEGGDWVSHSAIYCSSLAGNASARWDTFYDVVVRFFGPDFIVQPSDYEPAGRWPGGQGCWERD